MNYISYFEELEKSREAGDVDIALLKSQQALLEAGQLHDPVLAINALGHQLLIFKDQFTKTDDEFYLHLMHAICNAGVSLCDDLSVSGQPKAVMFLRSGDYYFHLKKYDQAVTHYRKAVAELGEIYNEKPGEYSEYLSHLGKAKVHAGDISGEEDLRKAVELSQGKTELRDFHKRIVHSENLARLALSLMSLGKKEESLGLIKQIAPIAKDLKDNYNMPIRWQQLEKACNDLGLSIDSLL